MGKIKVTRCEIEGLCAIEPTVFKDERGYFVEIYNQNDFWSSYVALDSMKTIGINYNGPNQAQVEEGRELAKALPSWPIDGSIKLMDDYVIVKLQEDMYYEQ